MAVRGGCGGVLGAAGLLILYVALVPRPLAAQLHGQHWEVTPLTDSATVGDTVTVAFRVRLDERDLLFDTVPRPAAGSPEWVRVLEVEKLRRGPDRLFTGRARLAFYRPGRRALPVFELPFMRSVKGLSRGTLSSDTASIEIVPLVSDPSSATLRDIREPPPTGGPGPFMLATGMAVLAAAAWAAWRLRARRPAPMSPPAIPAAAPPPAPPDPYDVALARLAAIERERWSERDVTRHYESVSEALRDYLEARGVPARERTTSELRWVLPPALLAGGHRRRFEEVFEDADLVKFARWRPDAGTAGTFLVSARELLAGWRPAAAAGEEADAVR